MQEKLHPQYRTKSWYNQFWQENENAYGKPTTQLLEFVNAFWTEIQNKDWIPKNVLDVGAGNGRYSLNFAEIGFKTKAIDLSSTACDLIKKKAIANNLDLEVTQGNFLEWNNQSETFGLVFSSGMIDELTKSKQKKAVESLMNITTVGGMNIIKYCLEIKNRGMQVPEGLIPQLYQQAKWDVRFVCEEASLREYGNGVSGEDALRTGTIVAIKKKI
jgi:ubiquinone/menaquinone biosynthesis C-methylase UbiE